MEPGTAQSAIRAAVDLVWHRLPEEGQAETALRTLATILGNLQRCPGESKYRILRKANPALQQRLRDCGSCFDVLRLCGFEETPLAYELLAHDLCGGACLNMAEEAGAYIQESLARGPPREAPPTADGSDSEQNVLVHFDGEAFGVEWRAREEYCCFQDRLASATGVPAQWQELSEGGRALLKENARARLARSAGCVVLEDARDKAKSDVSMVELTASTRASSEASSAVSEAAAAGAAGAPSSAGAQGCADAADPASSQAALLPLGADDGARHALPSSRSLFVGSGAGADVPAAGDTVEARHCVVYAVAEASPQDDQSQDLVVEVEDLSEAGTFCNGRRLNPPLVRHVLSHGDVLSLGTPKPLPGAAFRVDLPETAGAEGERHRESAPSFLRFTLDADLPEDAVVHVRGDPDLNGGRECELLRETSTSSKFHSLAMPVSAAVDAEVSYSYTASDARGHIFDSAERTARVPLPGHVRLVEDSQGLPPEGGAPSREQAEVPMGGHCKAELDSWTQPAPGRLAGRQKCFQLWHEGFVLPFFLYVPPGPPPEADGWPLLVHLHGDQPRSPGDCPLPGVSHAALSTGPPSFFASPEQRSFVAARFVCLAPQCPPEYYWFKEGNWYSGRWSAKMESVMTALLGYVEKSVSIDRSRRYLTGNSMGGYGAWEFARLLPDAFAAVAPVSAHFGERRHDDLARAVAGVPLRIYHGIDDNVCLPRNTELLVAALERAGATAEVLWVQMPRGREHDADIVAYHESDDLFQWFLQHRRGKQPEAAADGEGCFYVCGSWSDWALEEMCLEANGVLTCIASVDEERKAVFQIVKDKDWRQRYFPRVVDPGVEPPKSAAYCICEGERLRAWPNAVEGPGPRGHGCNWLIDATGGRGDEEPQRGANARFKVCFDPSVPSISWAPDFDRDERAAVRRLAALGVSLATAADAYVSAGRSEELASASIRECLASGPCEA